MFCSQCGANNSDTAVICAQCGRNLQAVTSASPLQPTPLQATGVVPTPGMTVQNYLVFAILTTVFCCLPTGIPAIIYAAQVNGKLQAGDVAGAQIASKNAKMWCLISLGLGIGCMALYAILIMVGVLSGIHQNR